MSPEELVWAMPSILAEDLVEGERRSHRKVIFLDSFECLLQAGEDPEQCFRNLIEATSGILWVAFSRKKIEWDLNGFQTAEVRPFNETEREEFWASCLPEATAEVRSQILGLGDGHPFHMERLADYCRQLIVDGRPIVPEDLEKVSRGELVRRQLRELNERQRDILYLLAAADQFDPMLFHEMFPNYHFWLYQDWFSGELFESRSDERGIPSFALKRIYGDEIRKTCRAAVLEECNRKLFAYYDRSLITLLKKYKDAEPSCRIKSIFLEFCKHGELLKNRAYFLTRLTELTELLILSGERTILLNEYYKMEKCPQTQKVCGNWGILCCQAQEAKLNLMAGNYREAERVISEGLAITLKDDEPLVRLYLLRCQMELYSVRPKMETGQKTGKGRAAICAGEEYLKYVEKMAPLLQTRDALMYRLTAYLFLGKQFLTIHEIDQAKKLLEIAVALGEDKLRVNTAALQGLLAKAQEELGEVYATEGRREEARALYHGAAGSFELADCLDSGLNYEQMLDQGLVYKRLAESYFGTGELEAGLSYQKRATEQYDAVERLSGGSIDLYCKIGWANVMAAEQLMKEGTWEKERAWAISKYLENAAAAAKKGCQCEKEHLCRGRSDGRNRQLFNLRCTAERLQGRLSDLAGQTGQADYHLRKALKISLLAIRNAPDHPYSYSECAESALAYGSFLAETGRPFGEIAQRGLDSIAKGLILSPREGRFLSIRRELEDLCSRGWKG